METKRNINLLTDISDSTISALIITLSIVCTVLVVVIIYLLFSKKRKAIISKAEADAKKIKMEIISKSQFESQIKNEELNNLIAEKNEEINNKLKELQKKENNITLIEEELKSKKENIKYIKDSLEKREKELKKEIQNVTKILEKTSGLSTEESREIIIKFIENDEEENFKKKIQETHEFYKNKVQEVANEYVLDALQHINVDFVSKQFINIIDLPSDDYKGKIIGKNGINLRTFEAATGVDVVIGELDKKVTISSFNPVRREIASRTLETLIRDSKLQPFRIEEEYERQKILFEDTLISIGQKTCEKLGISDIHLELKKYIGRLNFRTSYGQNVLMHSVETAQICGILAEKLKLNTKKAIMCGLFHDIGKAVDYEKEGSHVTVGIEILEKYISDPIILNAVAAHHGDIPKESIYAELVVVGDSISASRIGARNSDLEVYTKQLQEIEDICNSFKGVQQTYAFKSGRQIRVIVDPQEISDLELKKLQVNIKEKLSKVMKIPGDIYLTVIRQLQESIKIN